MDRIEHAENGHGRDDHDSQEHREKTVTVYYKHEPYELERRTYAYQELIDIFKVPAGYKLDLIEGNGEFHELKPGDTVKIRKDVEFTSHAPCGQSS